MSFYLVVPLGLVTLALYILALWSTVCAQLQFHAFAICHFPLSTATVNPIGTKGIFL